MTATTPANRGTAKLWKLLGIGAVAGLFGGLFGLGGGIIIVPALVLLLGFNQRQAAATSALALLPTAITGVISYGSHGAVDWAAGLALALGIIVGAQLGARLLHKLSLRALEWLFFGFLLVAIALLWLVVPERGAHIAMSPLVFISLIGFGVIPGLAMALLGVGGGVIAIPVLITAYGASDLAAKGSSLLMVLVGSATATVKHLRARVADPRTALTIGLTAALVTPFSVQLAVLMTPFVSNALFSVFLAVIAAQYLRRLLRADAGKQ